MDLIYREVGAEKLHELTRRFYEGVAQDPILRPLYPDEDLEPARRRLALFLIQYFGGPRDYAAERGDPRLRMRHMPFKVDPAARDAWMRHMRAALDAVDLPEHARRTMLGYFEQVSTFLTNAPAAS